MHGNQCASGFCVELFEDGQCLLPIWSLVVIGIVALLLCIGCIMCCVCCCRRRRNVKHQLVEQHHHYEDNHKRITGEVGVYNHP